MNNELGRVWKEEVVAYFKIISWNSPGGTEEIHEKPNSRYSVFRARFQSGIP
jgi:hypothetical protein